MNADVYTIEGNKKESVELPHAFSAEYREDLVRRALLSEQSRKLQPQGHSPLAGLQTTALYVGTYGGYRRGRHMGIAIRPRQKLGGGAMGDVRRIPSAVKGKRAHPHMTIKIIKERINKREYIKAIESAIAGCAMSSSINERHPIGKQLPIIIEDSIENVTKTKDLLKILGSLGFSKDIELSHKPKLLTGRGSKKRKFRRSLLLVVGDSKKIKKAGRNIAGVDVINVKELNIETLAPGVLPRPTVWSKSAISGLTAALKEM